MYACLSGILFACMLACLEHFNKLLHALPSASSHNEHMYVCTLTPAAVSTDVRKFCSAVQKKLLDEIVDRDVQKGMRLISLAR